MSQQMTLTLKQQTVMDMHQPPLCQDGVAYITAVLEISYRSQHYYSSIKDGVWWAERRDGKRYERNYQPYCSGCRSQTQGSSPRECYGFDMGHFSRNEHVMAEYGFDIEENSLDSSIHGLYRKWLEEIFSGNWATFERGTEDHLYARKYLTVQEIAYLCNFWLLRMKVSRKAAYKKTSISVINKFRKKYGISAEGYVHRGYYQHKSDANWPPSQPEWLINHPLPDVSAFGGEYV